MKLVFDIGANNGEISQHFSRIAEKVIAFECNPNLVKRLEKQFKDSNVIIDSRGLSNQEGELLFNVCDAATLSTFAPEWIDNSRFSEEHYWSIAIPVKTTTLDNAIAYYGVPDYVKIDVEGYEYEVIQGLTQLIPDTTFCFEWVEEQWDKVELIIAYLKVLGYNLFSVKDEDGIWMDTDLKWEYWDTINNTNIVAERKQRWGMIYFKYKN